LLLLVLILAVFVAVQILATGRNRRGAGGMLRPIPGYDVARGAIARAAEEGHSLHLAPGPDAVGESGTRTAETLAGLAWVGALSEQAALTGAPMVATTGDAVSLILT